MSVVPEPSVDRDAIAQRASAGDAAALNALFALCHDQLKERIHWMLGDRLRQACETGDIASELWLKLSERLAKLTWHDEQHFLRLATQIARRHIIDRARSQDRSEIDLLTTRLLSMQSQHAEKSPIDSAEETELLVEVLERLETLPEHYREVLRLRILEGQSVRAVAELTRRSEDSVRAIHARALVRLGRVGDVD